MMKKCLSILFVLLLLLGVAAAQEEVVPEMRIRFTIGDTVAYATLEENSASRAFYEQLPLELTFGDYNRTEKIAYPPEKLDTSDAPDSCDPDVGTFAYYEPWGNVCIFYQDFRFSNGLVPLGTVTEGMEAVADMEDEIVVLVEAFVEEAIAEEAGK